VDTYVHATSDGVVMASASDAESEPHRHRQGSVSDLRLWTKALLGSVQRSRAPAPALPAALHALTTRWPDPTSTDDPILVLSASWRSGSTFVQRLVNSSGSVLMWGEPLQECGIFRHLADMLLAYDPVSGRLDRTFLEPSSQPVSRDVLAGTWTAMLSPTPHSLMEGHRSLLTTLLAQPAQAAGFPRWGVKETTLPGEYAYYFRLLFPQAKVVFLVRDPVAAWRSYRPQIANPWYQAWPSGAVAGPRRFGAMWTELADSFLRWRDPTQALLLRYEDLDDPGTLDRLESHLGISVDRTLAERRVGSSRSRTQYRERIPSWEVRALRRATKAVPAEFGYHLGRATK
jgi:hypothetical protein